MNSGSTYEDNVIARNDISVIKLGLKIPNKAINYGDFKKQMHESELSLQTIIFSYDNSYDT